MTRERAKEIADLVERLIYVIKSDRSTMSERESVREALETALFLSDPEDQ